MFRRRVSDARSAQLGHTRDERRLEGSLGAGGASRRSASLPPSVSPALYGRGPRGKRKRRRRRRFSPSRESRRRDATTSDRPSVESFSPRPHVDRNTRSPTRYSHPVQWCAAPFSSGSCHSISSARRDDLVLPRRIIESLSSLFSRRRPLFTLVSFHSRQLSDNLFVHPPSWDASRSFLR